MDRHPFDLKRPFLFLDNFLGIRNVPTVQARQSGCGIIIFAVYASIISRSKRADLSIIVIVMTCAHCVLASDWLRGFRVKR